MTVSNGDYAAPLVTQSKNGFLTSLLREDLRKFLFLNPNFLVGGMIAQFSMNLSTPHIWTEAFFGNFGIPAPQNQDFSRRWSLMPQANTIR